MFHVRVFRVALPVSNISVSRSFYERLLGIEADDTVPSRLYFHCGEVILAIIDWKVEPLGPFRPNPENLYLSTRMWTKRTSVQKTSAPEHDRARNSTVR